MLPAQPFPLIYRFYLENSTKGVQNDLPHYLLSSIQPIYVTHCHVSSYFHVSDMDHFTELACSQTSITLASIALDKTLNLINSESTKPQCQF